MQGQHLDWGDGRIEIQIDQGEVNVCAVVILAERGAPVGIPEVVVGIAGGAMAQGIERLVDLGFLEIAGGNDAVDRVDLRGQLALLIWDNVVFGLSLGNTDWLGDALEQIDHRGAAELKRVAADALFEGDQAVRLVGLFEEYQDFERVAKTTFGKAVQTLQIDEEEFLGEAEILLQQAVAQEAAVGVRQDALGGSESDGLQTAGGQNGLSCPFTRRQGPHGDAESVEEEELVERVDGGTLSVEVEAKGIEGQLLKAESAQAFDPNANHGGRFGGHAGHRETIHRRDGGAGDPQRPQGDRITGTERADTAIFRLAVDRETGFHLDRCRGALRRIELKLDDGLGRHGPEVVRVEHVKKRFSDFRELVVELAMHAAGQKREGFDEPFDVRIFAGVGLQQQAPGHLGILLRELAGHLADELQLALVVGQQLVDHAFPPETARRRDSRNRATSKVTGSSAGPIRRNASI